MAVPSLPALLDAVCRRLREREARLRIDLGLSGSQFRGLAALEVDEILSCRDFSRRLALSESRGSRVIDRLVQEGLLSRTDCDADRRCKRLRLTPRGRALRLSMEIRRREFETGAAALLPPDSLDRLRADLRSLAEGL